MIDLSGSIGSILFQLSRAQEKILASDPPNKPERLFKVHRLLAMIAELMLEVEALNILSLETAQTPKSPPKTGE